MDITNTDAIISRINELIYSMSDNPSAFSKIVGLDPSNFSRKLKKQQPITEKDINKICRNAHISKEWLLEGIGERSAITLPANNDATDIIKDQIVGLAKRLAENKEEIVRLERENSDIMAQLTAFCSQLDNI